jgi:rhodanese-related sulfurtransferase
MRTTFKVILFVIIALLLYTFTGRQLLSAQEARSKIASGEITTVVDVRTSAEYSTGHYPGAIHIPVNQISRETTTSLPPRGLLVYCNTGQRARFAARQLSSLGFRDVYYIACTHKCLSSNN